MTSGWKQRGPIVILALHKFVTYLYTYPLTYSPWIHTGLTPGPLGPGQMACY